MLPGVGKKHIRAVSIVSMPAIPASAADTYIVAENTFADVVPAHISAELGDLGNVFVAKHLTVNAAYAFDIRLKIRTADRHHAASEQHIIFADLGYCALLYPQVSGTVEDGSFHFIHNIGLPV